VTIRVIRVSKSLVVLKIFGNFVPNFREWVANSKNYKVKTKQKGMTPMNTQMKTLMTQHIFNSDSCRILIATCLSALCLIALSTQAATITVTNTNDSGPGSLRQAIADANDGDTIDFGVTGTITLTTGEVLVDKSITISGPGSDNLTVDGNLASRVFYVSSGVTATVAGLSITNGGEVPGAGGGIYNDHSTHGQRQSRQRWGRRLQRWLQRHRDADCHQQHF